MRTVSCDYRMVALATDAREVATVSSTQGHDGHCAEYGERGPVHVQYDAALAYARELGAQHGRNAASWYEIADATQASRILDGIEDGDPAILDTLPYPDLSGEWADSLTGPALVSDALTHAGIVHGDGSPYPMGHAPGACRVCDWWDATGDICDAYELAFSEAVSDEVARLARIVELA